mmetsp:Transcript_58364/g.147997  ORF Transcript_58364/g.147997 Transcript_58364/m.147997 type:complete len:219 (+) Transcript_58364:1378-2034(+)
MLPRKVHSLRAKARAIHSRDALMVPRLKDVDFAGDGYCGPEVVTGDHHYADAGLPSSQDRLRHTGALRVDGSRQAEQPQACPTSRELLVWRDLVVLRVERQPLQGLRSYGEHTECVRSICIDDFLDFSPFAVCQRRSIPVLQQQLRAIIQDHTGCTFANDEQFSLVRQRYATGAQLAPARHVRDREHHLAAGGKGNLQHAFVLIPDALVEADLPCGHN